MPSRVIALCSSEYVLFGFVSICKFCKSEGFRISSSICDLNISHKKKGFANWLGLFSLTLKVPITTAAEDKFCNIYSKFSKKIRYDILWEFYEIPCLICYFWKSSKIWNCRLLHIIGGALWVKTTFGMLYIYYIDNKMIKTKWFLHNLLFYFWAQNLLI